MKSRQYLFIICGHTLCYDVIPFFIISLFCNKCGVSFMTMWKIHHNNKLCEVLAHHLRLDISHFQALIMIINCSLIFH